MNLTRVRHSHGFDGHFFVAALAPRWTTPTARFAWCDHSPLVNRPAGSTDDGKWDHLQRDG